MSVRLLFQVVEKKEVPSWDRSKSPHKMGAVNLAPVYPQPGAPNEEEQKAFYAATPSGHCEFATINEAALAQFEVGRQFYITLSPVPVPEPVPVGDQVDPNG